MWAGARPAPAAGACDAALAGQHNAGQRDSASSPRVRARAPAPVTDVPQRRGGPAPAPARVADAEPPCRINEPYVAPLYLQTAQLL